MVFEAKNELKQYLSSTNLMYAKSTDCLRAKEVSFAAQLGNVSVPVMHACGVENPVHAGDIIAQSKSSGPISAVVLPLFIFQQVEEAVQLQVAFELIQTHKPVWEIAVCTSEYCQHAYMSKRAYLEEQRQLDDGLARKLYDNVFCYSESKISKSTNRKLKGRLKAAYGRTVQGFKLSFTHREVLKLQPAHHGASRAAPSSARAMTHIFADIDKAALSLPLGCEVRPYKRVLCYQAHLAQREAIQAGLDPD
ncbi:TPA: hypothetical protein ACH3X1_001539 [Trebouxia sp. C0004]